MPGQERVYLLNATLYATLELMNAGELALIQTVVGILLLERDENCPRLLRMAIPDGGDGQHHAREGSQIVALCGGEPQQADALLLIRLRSGHVQNPAQRRGLEAEHIILDAAGQVGVVHGGLERERLAGVAAGLLGEVERR